MPNQKNLSSLLPMQSMEAMLLGQPHGADKRPLSAINEREVRTRPGDQAAPGMNPEQPLAPQVARHVI